MSRPDSSYSSNNPTPQQHQSSIDRADEFPAQRPPSISPPPYDPPNIPEKTPQGSQQTVQSSTEPTPDFRQTRIGSAVLTHRSVASNSSSTRLRPASTSSSRREQQHREASPDVRQRLMSPSVDQQQQQQQTLHPQAGEKYVTDRSGSARSALTSAGARSRSSSARTGRTNTRPSTSVTVDDDPKAAATSERESLDRRANSLERHIDYNGINMCGDNPMVKLAIGGGIALFVVVFSLAMIIDSAHTIDEGTVGIYFVQGALDDRISYPGVHWSIPFVTTVEEVTVRPRTDTLSPIGATTKDGIQNTFRDIQVISDVTIEKLVPLVKKFGLDFRKALVFDRVNEEVRTFCAKHNIDEVYNTMFLDMVSDVKMNVEKSIDRIGMGGIKILNLAIPKPEIPVDIAKNYKQVKVQWTEQLVATQQQKTEQIKKETESIKAVLDAERQKKVLAIDIEKEVLRKQGEKDLSTLENQIVKEREESVADIENYKKRKYAEANQVLYTDSYVKLEMAKHLSNNTKFFFSGENSIFGSLLTGILEGKN